MFSPAVLLNATFTVCVSVSSFLTFFSLKTEGKPVNWLSMKIDMTNLPACTISKQQQEAPKMWQLHIVQQVER